MKRDLGQNGLFNRPTGDSRKESSGGGMLATEAMLRGRGREVSREEGKQTTFEDF